MMGSRIPDCHDPGDVPPLTAGEYIRIARPGKKDLWYACSPTGELGNLSGHSIEIHDDRTITVTPSIWFDTPKGWHGFLTKGVWTHA